MHDYDEHDATGLAALVAEGEVTPAELVEAAIARIEARNPSINAIATQRYDEARLEAQRPLAGPFAGVPLLLKDVGAHMAGQPHHFGAKVLRDVGYLHDTDSNLGRRFENAGFVTLGRTTSPEFAVTVLTESEATGITRNPWDPDYITGGSSGGAAAAVAARIVPVAHANDGAGSIRMPASITGTVGLKSSRARVSNGPLLGEAWAGLAHEGAITRTVRDAARVLDAIAGNDPGDPYYCPPPSRPFSAELGVDPGRLRIGLVTSVTGFETHKDCVAAVEATARQLASLGHEIVTPAASPLDMWADQLPAFLDLISSHVVADVHLVQTLVSRRLELDEFSPLTAHYYERGHHLSACDYIGLVERLQGYGRDVASWWPEAGLDLLLTPTLAGPPARIGTLDFDATNGDKSLWEQYSYFPYTPAFNVSGQPAISLPLHRNGAELPIGVQLAAEFGREDLLIRVASQLEEAFPWAGERPALTHSAGVPSR